MVYNNLVATVGPEGRLDGLGNGSAGINVADDSSIFSVVAVVGWLAVYTEQMRGNG